MYSQQTRTRGWIMLTAGLALLLAGHEALAQTASLTSPESGGETYRIARISGDAAGTPNKLLIEAPGGSTWTFRPISGFNATEETGESVYWDVMSDPVEFEVEAVDAEEGTNTFTLTFRFEMMMMVISEEDPATVDVDLNYSIGTPVSRQTVLRQVSGLPVTPSGGSFFTTESAFTPLGTQFSLSYNSRASYFPTPPDGMPAQPFGNWYASFYRYFSPISGTQNHVNFRGRGEVVHWLFDGNNSHDPDVPEAYDLNTNGSGYTTTLDLLEQEKYDSDGKLTALEDSNDNQWTFDYGTVGSYSAALTKMTDPNGDTYTLTYDATPGLVTKVEYSFTGTTWELSYDSDDYLTKLVASDCAACGGDYTRTFTYSSGDADPDLNGNLLTVKNASATQTEAFSYSSTDKATKVTLGQEEYTYGYDAAARRMTKTDALAHDKIFWIDGINRVTKTDLAGIAVTSFVFDTQDNVTKTTLPEGLVVEREFDADKHLTKQTRSKGSQSVSESWVYDANVQQVTKYTDVRGEEWLALFDANGNLTKRTDPEVSLGVPSARQAVVTHAYDSRGNRTKTVDALGVEHHFLYSEKNLLTKQVDDAAGGGLQVANIWHYESNGRLTKMEDAFSSATTYEYDGFRRTKQTSPLGVVTVWEYDIDGRLTRQIQASEEDCELVTDFVYDHSDRVTKQTVDPDGLALVTERLFDVVGNLTRTENADGEFGPTLVYDAINRVTRQSYGGLDTDSLYDDASRVTKRTESGTGSNTASYTTMFDGLGRRTKATGPLNHYQTFEYNEAGNVTKQLSYQSDDTLLADARTYFDEVGRIYKSEAMDGGTIAATEMLHDVAGRLTKREDPLDDATTFQYDALGRRTRVTDPLSNSTDPLYDAAGRQTKVTDALGNATETYFDADGQVTKQVDQTGAATVFAYDALGRRTRRTDPLSNDWDRFFDVAGRLTKSADPVGGERTSEYDDAGRQTKVTVKVTATESRSTTFAFSDIGRLTRTTDPLSNTTDMEYDLWGRVTKRTDAETNATKFLFDAAGQPTKTIAPGDGPALVTEYDGLGQRTRVLNDDSVTVLRFHYDNFGRQTKLEYANDDAETFAYDLDGSRTKRTRPTGEEITYLYDARGMLTKSTLPGSVVQTFEYDAVNRRTKADDPNTDLAWVLDAAGRVTKLTDGTLSKTIVYAYDAAGRRTKLDGPESSDTQHWSFDSAGQVTKITEDSSDRAVWLYNLAGQQTKLTYGSGSYQTNEYDAVGRITNLVHKKSGGSVIQSFAYVLDDAANRTKLTLDGGDWYAFDYDSQYQLTKETRKTSGGTLQYSNTFWYDNRGNRTKLDADDGSGMGQPVTTTYLYSLADQLTKESVGGTDWTYSYDANGAMTRKSDGTNNHEYLYDARSLITKYDGPGTSNDTTYAWDVQDRRVKKDVNSTVTRMLYDNMLGEILAEYDGAVAPALKASYVPTGLDDNISMTRSGSVYYFHPDALHSTWNISSASDEVVQNTYAFQAFGSLYGSATENVGNTRRFTGAEWNSESATQSHGVRVYLPTLGRWNYRDPIPHVPFIYGYVRNSPIMLMDPDGKEPQFDPGPSAPTTPPTTLPPLPFPLPGWPPPVSIHTCSPCNCLGPPTFSTLGFIGQGSPNMLWYRFKMEAQTAGNCACRIRKSIKGTAWYSDTCGKSWTKFTVQSQKPGVQPDADGFYPDQQCGDGSWFPGCRHTCFNHVPSFLGFPLPPCQGKIKYADSPGPPAIFGLPGGTFCVALNYLFRACCEDTNPPRPNLLCARKRIKVVNCTKACPSVIPDHYPHEFLFH